MGQSMQAKGFVISVGEVRDTQKGKITTRRVPEGCDLTRGVGKGFVLIGTRSTTRPQTQRNNALANVTRTDGGTHIVT